ncbi:MAG TPA: hypothetical protein VEX35_00720 [Allosphingosinicella sp.]|nr:hypothetical protein [Allosphingosinicella sp.]
MSGPTHRAGFDDLERTAAMGGNRAELGRTANPCYPPPLPKQMLPRWAALSLIDARIWPLDAAVEHGVDIRTLAAPDMGEVLNRRPHGHSSLAIARILAQMVEEGEITVHREFGPAAPAVALCEGQIGEMLSESRDTKRPSFYRLTEHGGAEWEVWAKPQWSRYSTSCGRKRRTAIGAATAAVAEELLGLHEYLHHDEVIVERSIRRRTFHRWHATYWKTLPEGHLIGFRTHSRLRSEWSPMPHREWARWVDLRKFYLKRAGCGF